MPIYEYSCISCGRRFEKLVQKMDSPPPTCPDCLSGETERQIERVSPFRWGRGGSWI